MLPFKSCRIYNQEEKNDNQEDFIDIRRKKR